MKAALIGAVLLLGGCGYIGEPLPPSLHIPARVAGLTAVQRGSHIVAQFAVPRLSTDGLVLKQEPRLELRVGPKWFGPFNGPAWAATAKPAGSPVVENSVARYQLPVSEWIGKDVTVAARAIGRSGRDAGWSDPVTLAVVQPLPQPIGLRAESAPQGVRLAWQAPGNAFVIYRRGPDEKIYTIAGHADHSEWIDTTAEFGKTYSYLVQAVAKVGEGQAESEVSEEARITPADTFPPAVPAGLTAVPSTASIELVWERNVEPDLAGYRVYRALGSGRFDLVSDTQEPPSFSDRRIESGKVYRYAVSAVKRNGLESKMSPPVEVTAP